MTMLPDVPEDDYRSYQADQFSSGADQRIGGLGFESAANARIATLEPPPAPPPPSPQESLGRIGGWAQAPPPTLPPDAFDQSDQSDQTQPQPQPPPQPATPAPPPTDTSLPAPPPTQSNWLTDTLGSGLTAVQRAGGDVDAFAQDFGSRAVQTTQDAIGSALTAASRAGADVDQFLQNFQPQPAAPTPSPSSLAPRDGDLQAYARQAALRAGIDPDIFVRQIQQESGFDPTARSGAGAIGIAQFMPGTAQGLGVDPADPYAALDAAARMDAQNLKQYGGDWSRTLAAYNAGPGAVDRYGGVPPFEETQRYVNTILGGANPPPVSAYEGLARVGSGLEKGVYQDLSQFGDRQLSADEAYAACGPAAAVRFAERFGRNPTLREATDLAAQVGWTPGSGMAGIGSEKALMDKLGVPTRLVGPDLGTIAQEASTGNPVTISTPGHYFFADSYDPNSGAFHVGQSGLDLKGGAEWMTADQMQRLMGPIQGALLADNPQVPAPSTADQASNPTGFLDRARSSIGSFFSGVGTAVRHTPLEPAVPDVQQLDQAVSSAAQPSQPFQRLAPGAEGGPPQYTDFGRAAALGPVSDDAGRAVLEALQTSPYTPSALLGAGERAAGQAISETLTQPGGPLGPQRQAVSDTLNSLADQIGTSVPAVGGVLRAASNIVNAPTLVDNMRTMSELDDKYGAGNWITNPDMMTPEDRARANAALMAVVALSTPPEVAGAGGAAGAAARAAGLAERAAAPVETAIADASAAAAERPIGVGSEVTWEGGARSGTVLAEQGNNLVVGTSRDGLETVPRSTPDLRSISSEPAEAAAPPVEPAPPALVRPTEGGGAAPPVEPPAGGAGGGAGGEPPIPAPPPSGAPRDVPWDPLQSADPANRTVGRMYTEQQAVPETPQGTLVQRFVRAMTNRFEAADRYQQAALRDAGYTDLQNPPQALDLSALLRQQAGDAAAEVRVARDLKPAIQSAGDDQAALTTYLTHQNNIDVANAIGDQVMRDLADRPVDPQLTADLNAARTSLRMRQQMLENLRNDSVPDTARISAAQRSVNAAQRTVARRQAVVDTARQAIIDDAAQQGQAARNTRAFSGGLRVADSEGALDNMRSEMTPDRFARVEQAANNIGDYVRGLRQTLVDSGVISQDTANLWANRYPHWVPTRVLDYLDEGAQTGGLRPGAKISLRDSGIRSFSTEGTARFRENPLGALVDLTHQVESKSRRNRVANAFVDLDQLRPASERQLQQTSRPALANEPVVQRINNGTVERYLAPPELATAINGPNISLAPGFVRHWTNFVRNVTTAVSPAFALARNPSLDIPEYYQRTLGRMGGNPLLMPRLTAALANGYADAFQGLLQGEFRGPLTQRYLLGGGGSGGIAERDIAGRARTVQQLTRPELEFGSPAEFANSVKALGGSVIQRPQDLLGVAKQLATLRPVAALAERTELGPRLAAMRLAEEQGATPARAVLNGRTVTMDFNEGGTLAKTLNSFIPFFNAGIQGTAQVVRGFRENPSGMLAATGLNVGLPSALAEVWNNSDPQRARDYADVPQYLKDQGVVIMLPGEAPVDAQGNRHPQFWWVNMRGYAPFASAARTAVHQALESSVGTPTPTNWQDVGQSLLGTALPVRANTIADVPGGLLPQVPYGGTTLLQLRMNQDIFRNRQIATARNDQQAAQASREIADALTRTGRMISPDVQVRPSQVDFAVRDMLGGVGASALGARQLLPGAEGNVQNQPQNVPLAGGILTALGVRGSGGELGTQARNNLITNDSQRWLQSQGVDWTPSPVTPTIGKVPLTSAEETHYQQLANTYTEQRLQELRQYNALDGLPRDEKLKEVQRAVDSARKEAAGDVSATISDADWNRRLDAAYAAAAAQ